MHVTTNINVLIEQEDFLNSCSISLETNFLFKSLCMFCSVKSVTE